jgi:hypothetical protein
MLLAIFVGVVGVAVVLAAFAELGGSSSAVRLRGDSVAVLDARTGEVLADIPFHGTPGPVLTALGSVWVADPEAQTLTRISPETLRSSQRGIAVVPWSLGVSDGSLLAYDGTSGRGVSFNPSTDQQTLFHARQPPCLPSIQAGGNCYLGGLAVGGGHIWVGTVNSETVWRLDPQQLTADAPRVRNVRADQLAWGAGGLWALGNNSQYLWHVDANSLEATRRYPTHFFAPTLPFATGNGQVWVINPNGSVIVVTPLQGVSATVPLRPGLTNLTISGNWLWVTSADGRLYKISVFSKRVAHIYQLHHQATAVAVGFNRVWVSLAN